MLCVLCLIVLWGFSLVTSYSGVIDYNYTPQTVPEEGHLQVHLYNIAESIVT